MVREKVRAGGTHEGGKCVSNAGRSVKGPAVVELDLIPTIGRWAEACFPVESQASEKDLRELLEEAAEAARDDYGAESAVAWAEGYTFPSDYMASDIRCLRAAQLDFEVMIRRRLKQTEYGAGCTPAT
jgi:hypothetical protein